MTKKLQKSAIKVLGLGVLLLAYTSSAFAAESTTEFNVGTYLIAQNQQFNPISAYIVRTINFLAMIIGSFAFLTIVVGGIMLLTSGGREHALTRGKDMIKYAVIGLVVALSAYFITAFVQSIFYEIPSK
jgi:hypothetical protein